ncbi:MRN complex-interacting protein isoform X1 [Scyliorhinus canicula]|uniref:MRN complex-interacting protein isoform X1 n=2 Tax=Scyliorhinus canicula TaxID=7830 RepID=UPI0018F376D0|nr:MRN complex-interacting protein isoform X1 [Scyliorhinus canicula]
MAQQFQALRCCFCKIYQVHQVKKSKKWNCKLCGEKQSLLKVYGQGSGADCRRHVQKLNLLQGESMQAMEAAAWSIEESTCSSTVCNSGRFCTMSDQVESPASNRWSVYLDQKPVEEASEDEGEGGEVVYTDRQHFQAGVRNASRDGRKRKRGLNSDCKHPHPYGNSTDHDEKQSAQQKMISYLKYVNSKPSENRNRNPEIGDAERSNVLNWSQLESNPTAHLRDEGQPGTAASPVKRQSSRWDQFLPHSSAEDNKLFNQDSGDAESHPTWKRGSPCTDQPSACFVLEDQGAYRDSSSLTTDNGWPSSSLATGRVTEGIVAQPPTSLELVGETRAVLGLPELASDVHEPSGRVCKAVKATPAHEPIPTSSTHGVPGVLHILKSGTPLTPLIQMAHQFSACGMPSAAPRLHVKPSSFLSLFQTDEDFDDL